MGSNTAFFRFDEAERTMQYIAQSHVYQSWRSATNSNQYLARESNVGIHQTTMAIRMGSVGIGTTLPIATLDVNGDINVRGTLNIPSYTFESSNQSSVLTVRQLNTACNIAGFFQGTQSVPVLLVGPDNVGIGTSNPSTKLDIIGSVKSSGQLISTVATGTAPLKVSSSTLVFNLNAYYLNGQSDLYYLNATNITTGILKVSYGGTGTNTHKTNKLLVGNGSNAIMTPIDLHWDGSNLGVGTSNPTNKLDVNGSIITSGQFISSLPSNIAPFILSSAMLSSNLNADLLDGQHGSYYQNVNNITSGILPVQYGGIGASNLTQNKLLVGNTSNAMIAADNLHWTSTSLGIGTSIPTDTLHVVGTIHTTSNLISTLPTGIAPFQVQSTTLNTNLNADLLDGQHGSYYQNADNVISGTLVVSRGGTGLNSLTANKLLVGNNTSAVSTPSDLHWASPNLGIGTITPTAKLHVFGAASFETDTSPFRFASSSTTSVSPYIYCLGKRNDGNTGYAFAGRIGLAKHRTDSNIPPSSTLGMIAFGGNCSNAQESNVAFTSSIIGVSEQSFSNIDSMATSIAFLTGNTGISMNNANITGIGKERMRIHSSGNIGIGTTSPAYALDVKGIIRATDQFINTVANGTPPFSIISTTLSSNLNADLLDGQHGSYYQNADNINVGILSVQYGGSGASTLTQNKLLVGNGTSMVLSPTSLHWSGSNLGVGTTDPNDALHVVGTVRTTSNFVSMIPTGTPPLQVSSTTLNNNLNADLLDDQHGSYYQNASNINAGILSVQYGGSGASTLTQNKLLVGNGTSMVLSPTSLHWSGSNLGIGTTDPNDALHVVGTVRTTSSFISMIPTGTAPLQVTSATLNSNLNADLLDGQHGSYYQNANNINMGVLPVEYGGSGASTLTQNKILVGNGTGAVFAPADLHWSGTSLGIGNASPANNTKLDVNGNIQMSVGDAVCGLTLKNTVGGHGDIGLATGGYQYSTDSQAKDLIVRSLAGRILLQSGGTTYGLCVNADNSVSTAGPIYVNGSGFYSSGINFASSDERVYRETNALVFHCSRANHMIFYATGAYTLMKLYGPDYPSAPARMEVGSIKVTASTSSGATTSGKIYNNAGEGAYNSSPQVSIDCASAVLSRAGGFYASSDARNKCDVRSIDLDYASDVIRKLRVVNFKFKSTDTGKIQTGFIAQDVEDVYPLALTYMRDKIPDIQTKVTVQWNERDNRLKVLSGDTHLPPVGTNIALIDANEKEWECVVQPDGVISCDADMKDMKRDANDDVMIYGRYVDDFRVLDKDALFSLSVAALQRAMKRIDDLESQLANIKSHLNI